jgi:hypothetical protein
MFRGPALAAMRWHGSLPQGQQPSPAPPHAESSSPRRPFWADTSAIHRRSCSAHYLEVWGDGRLFWQSERITDGEQIRPCSIDVQDGEVLVPRGVAVTQVFTRSGWGRGCRSSDFAQRGAGRSRLPRTDGELPRLDGEIGAWTGDPGGEELPLTMRSQVSAACSSGRSSFIGRTGLDPER